MIPVGDTICALPVRLRWRRQWRLLISARPRSDCRPANTSRAPIKQLGGSLRPTVPRSLVSAGRIETASLFRVKEALFH